MKKNVMLPLMIVFAWYGPAAREAWCDVAADAFSRGQTELAKGEFDAALGSFAAAVAADPGNDAYLARFEHVGKALRLRKQLDAEQDAARWTGIARALHMFYHQEKVFAAALELDRQLHDRLRNGLSATLLAQTLMVMDRPAEAAVSLNALPGDEHNLGTHAMLVIALVRAGNREQAEEVAESMEIPERLCAGKAYMVARMKAAIGEDDAAARLLKLAFAATPPNRLPAFKATAAQCPELAALLEKEAHRGVLETQSQVAARSAHRAGSDGHKGGHDADHDDHDHKDGHCATCPLQERVEDMVEKPKSSDCDDCKSDCNNAPKQ